MTQVTEEELTSTLEAIELAKRIKVPTSVKTISIESDSSVLKIINHAFEQLSDRGKGLCLEQLLRKFVKEKNEI